jgi:sugar phosphate isomerase/epimerase
MLKELGYDGLGGAAGDGPMATALEQAGLHFFNGYLTLPLVADVAGVEPKLVTLIDAMQGHRTALWLAVPKIVHGSPPVSSAYPRDEDAFAQRLKEIADYAATHGVKVVLYPHTGHYVEHFADALRMVDKLDHPNVGVTFNLCHWLKVEGVERDPLPLLRAAGARLMFVTINGVDTGDTKSMAWTRLIQPLGEGTYDVEAFLKKVRAAGYSGPIGFQGFGIKAPPREVLAKTMAAWQRMNATLR